MFKIQKESVKFDMQKNIGLLTYKIELAADGYEMKVEDLVARASGYDNIVFISVYRNNVLDYNEDIIEFYKQIVKINPYVNIYIYTNGKVKPRKLNNKPEIKYIVRFHCEDLFDFNDVNLQWFGKQQTSFIINVKSYEDIKKIDTYMKGIQIKKSQIYISLKMIEFEDKNFKDYLTLIKILEFNVFVDVDENVL